MTDTVIAVPLRIWPLPGALIVISVPIFEGVGVATGVLLGLGVGFGVGVEVGIGVGVGVGFGVDVEECRARDCTTGRPKAEGCATAIVVRRNTISIPVAPQTRAINGKRPFIWLNLPREGLKADAVLRRTVLAYRARCADREKSSVMNEGWSVQKKTRRQQIQWRSLLPANSAGRGKSSPRRLTQTSHYNTVYKVSDM